MKRSGSHTSVYHQQSLSSATANPSPPTLHQYDRQHQQLLQQHQPPHLQLPQHHSDSPHRQLFRSGGHRRHQRATNDGGVALPMSTNSSVESIPPVVAEVMPDSTARGFGDVGFPLVSRTRTTRSSYQLEEIPESVNSVTSSPVTSSYNVGHECVRRSRFVNTPSARACLFNLFNVCRHLCYRW